MNDLLLDSDTGDLLVQNGDFVVGKADAQIAELILRAYPGEFKENPRLGCYIFEQLNGTPGPFWRGNATSQLHSQGLKVKELQINDEGMSIELED